jgi:hypothetical protein
MNQNINAMMKTHIINAYAFNLRYAKALVKDVTLDMMTYSPAEGLENHPAFTLGHLISGAALTSKYLGGPYEFAPEWERLFKRNGPGDPRLPEQDTTRYPPKEQLLEELTKQHDLVEGLIQGLDKAEWNEPSPWRFRNDLPTLGDLLLFMCVTHESMHLGQLAAWRRAMGLDSALAVL